jgi:hypothetical protein
MKLSKNQLKHLSRAIEKEIIRVEDINKSHQYNLIIEMIKELKELEIIINSELGDVYE